MSGEKHVFFKGGVHPKEGKDFSCTKEIKDAPLLDKYTVILHQHIGAPPKPVVTKGDEVKKGQLLAEAGGFVSAPVHSPTSGKVSAMLDISGPMGLPMAAVEITPDGKDEFEAPFEKIPEWDSADPKNLKNRIAEKGIKDMTIRIHRFNLPFVHADRSIVCICFR